MCTEQIEIALMKQAIELAKMAAERGEVPVGALVVKSDTGEVISSAYNLRENGKIATAHAEILAIEEACRKAGGWRLSGYTLYVTLEPCPMCAGAIILARVSTVVWGVSDPKRGGGSVFNIFGHPGINHHPEIVTGVMESESLFILRDFFRRRREGLS